MIDAVRESGQLMERAAIVNWLREEARSQRDDNSFAKLFHAANAIERGEHMNTSQGEG